MYQLYIQFVFLRQFFGRMVAGAFDYKLQLISNRFQCFTYLQ